MGRQSVRGNLTLRVKGSELREVGQKVVGTIKSSRMLSRDVSRDEG